MKLKKYEIDAVVNKIMTKLRGYIKTPSYKKELAEKQKAHDEMISLMEKLDSINKQISNIRTEYNLGYVSKVNSEYPKFNYEKEESLLINKYIASKLPNTSDVEQDVIISNNTDLNVLINELISKYMKYV